MPDPHGKCYDIRRGVTIHVATGSPSRSKVVISVVLCNVQYESPKLLAIPHRSQCCDVPGWTSTSTMALRFSWNLPDCLCPACNTSDTYSNYYTSFHPLHAIPPNCMGHWCGYPLDDVTGLDSATSSPRPASTQDLSVSACSSRESPLWCPTRHMRTTRADRHSARRRRCTCHVKG